MPLLKYSLILMVFIMLFQGCADNNNNLVSPQQDGSTTPIDAFLQNRKLGRGINLGNALEAPAEGEWGVRIDDEYFRLIKEKGFNSVRLPIRWTAHALNEPPYAIDDEFFRRIDHIIERALLCKLAIVLNIHHFEDLIANPSANKNKLLALWKQISERYATYSGDLMFEILNEPNGKLTAELWNTYFHETLTLIRKTNPYRTIISAPGNWSGVDYLNTLDLPENDRNIIVTFHYYNPFPFTHQGAEWVQGSSQWLGTTWLGTQSEIKAMNQDLEKAAIWGKIKNRPLYIGEFGTYSRADMNSRVKWTGYLARMAEEKGLSWAYWEFCSGFGIYDAAKNEWKQELLNALIPPGA